jgi:hypothetical protein
MHPGRPDGPYTATTIRCRELKLPASSRRPGGLSGRTVGTKRSGHYQLVWNLLTACMRKDRGPDATGAHQTLVYDSRIPVFDTEGDGACAWSQVKVALRNPSRLLRCSRRRLIHYLGWEEDLRPLAGALREKYASF